MKAIVRDFHKVRLMRNGSFVGLYRPKVGLLGAKGWQLWRSVNDLKYGKTSYIGCKDGNPFCNEWYLIPSSIKLTNQNLAALDGMMGAGTYEVQRRIVAFANDTGLQDC